LGQPYEGSDLQRLVSYIDNRLLYSYQALEYWSLIGSRVDFQVIPLHEVHDNILKVIASCMYVRHDTVRYPSGLGQGAHAHMRMGLIRRIFRTGMA
jgi:hypothetical protein